MTTGNDSERDLKTLNKVDALIAQVNRLLDSVSNDTARRLMAPIASFRGGTTALELGITRERHRANVCVYCGKGECADLECLPFSGEE